MIENVILQVSDLDLEEFYSIVGEGNVLRAESDVEPYNIDWLHNHRY